MRRLNFEGLENLDNLPISAAFMNEKVQQMKLNDAIDILRHSIRDAEGDVNIPQYSLELWVKLVNMAPEQATFSEEKPEVHFPSKSGEKTDTGSSDFVELTSYSSQSSEVYNWKLQTKMEAAISYFHSPYPEVRSVTDPYDDVSTPAETWRMYLVGIIWCGLGVTVNQFFEQRFPTITLTQMVVQLFAYPSGLFLAWVTPKKKIKFWKYEIDLNPGPWSVKEQMLVTFFYGLPGSLTNSYGNDNIIAQMMPQFYGFKWVTWGYMILLCLSTNFMGLGIAGLMRRFAVFPFQMIWPSELPNLAVNRALTAPEKKENINGWKISKFTFLWIATAISFVYYWFPGYIFQALSTFSWMTWILPDNVNLSVITGLQGGLGFNPVSTWDYNNMMQLIKNPFATPFFATANTMMGMVISFLVIVGVYYSNYYWTSYMPVNSNTLFNNKGDPYEVREVLDSSFKFDQGKYDKYGPPFYTAGNLVLYGAFFAMYPFVFVYEILTKWRIVWSGLKRMFDGLRNWKKGSTFDGFDDPFSRMMRAYKEVHELWYISVLVISIVLAIVCVEIYPIDTPVWSIFFGLGMVLVFMIPILVLMAQTLVQFSVNVIVELIMGYALPGNGQALMFIKAMSTNFGEVAVAYIGQQKLGHYTKIPPRALFRVQVLGLLMMTFIQLAIVNYLVTMKDFCEPTNKQHFTCQNAKTIFNASVIWGVIGPKRVFDGLYPVLKWCFLIGALLGLLFIPVNLLFSRHRFIRHFQPSVILYGFINWAPYNLTYLTGGFYVSLAFMWYVKKRYLSWWEKYNYVLGGALNAGVAFSLIIIFFAVEYHPKTLSWWGNNVIDKGVDGAGGVSIKNATIDEPKGYFGPPVGSFP